MEELNYSPRLKEAAEEIKAILKKHDIGASVVLHTPGYSEYLNEICPSYSCIIEEDDHFRIRARLQEDFNGDREAWEKKINDTVNFIDHLAITSGQVSMQFFGVLDELKERMEIESTPVVHTPHTPGNKDIHP